MKYSIKPGIRASDLPTVIRGGSHLCPSIKTAVQIYVFALMIGGYSKTLTAMCSHFGIGIARLSRLLSHVLLGDELDLALDRRSRKIIAAYLRSHDHVSIDLIIDATVLERSSRKAENVGLYHTCGKKVWGHRITNVGILLDGDFYVPLASIPHKTKAFARICGLSYLTEGMMVCHWLRNHMHGLKQLTAKMSGTTTGKITVLLDAGYDNADVQKAIINAGAHFVMMIKCNRKVDGIQVRDFFHRNRCLKWTGIYLTKVVNEKTKRRKFRIRIANSVNLAGVGKVNVVCSEKSGRHRKENTRRFIATSDLTLTGREIVERYSRRWAIETWHKKVKQDYGIGDCSCSSFRSVENHIKLCLIAYCLHIENLKSLPKNGARLEDYLKYSVRKGSRSTTTQMSGREKLAEEITFYEEQVFSNAA